MWTLPNTLNGILGLIIITLAGVVYRLWNDGKSLQTKYDALQNQRVQDVKDTTDRVTQPLQSISQTIGLIYDKLQSSKEGK